ncbi:TlpA family protein disulfide reductase [Mucilaginibacter sp. RS28]|uniref:TlpA family protein disulfide reductase n=1 Tax=Mucilaginibacter straminoryzae TaxID=2932774 RepID=A0A9X1X067_9SPHI|nr:TlpA disulfide reductase family protein [Mucilaginibacter straminoryzae]MCJ8208842.1 TlpA family protein disulfide reductase [Mucilaginibacter straminoryzae]
MRLLFFILLACLCLNHLKGQSLDKIGDKNQRLEQGISLTGKNATITVINQTKDTINLKGRISFYLPISEGLIEEKIAPGKSSTIKIKMNYADFVQFTSVLFSIYTAPGKNVRCIIENKNPIKLKFEGDLSDENNYYQDYFKVARSNNVYYQAGGQIKDFNDFPALADSINKLNLDFLKNYDRPLPGLFKEYEFWRLMYNNAFLKHHVPFDLSFKSGRKMKLDSGYYRFDKETPLIGPSVQLSSEYLWYAVFRLRDAAINKNKPDSLLPATMLAVAENEFEKNEIGDVVKMRLLYDAYARSKSNYEDLLRGVTFANPQNRKILDSVSQARFSLPLMGKKAPGFRLMDGRGNTVELSQFKNHLIIINFWASWCAPCIQEFSFENKIYSMYKYSKNLLVINVCIDSSLDAWRKLSAKHQLQMVNLFADDVQTEYLKKQYNISSLPKSILLDGNQAIINNNFKRASEVRLQDLD